MRPSSLRYGLPLALTAALLIECALLRGQAQLVNAFVGTQGGTLRLPDGASVVVPPGALRRRTALSIREVPRLSDESVPPGIVIVGKRYALEPDDVVFARPVVVTLPYDMRLLPPLAKEGNISMFIWLPRDNFHMMANEVGDRLRESAGQDIDLVNKTVTVSTSFASIYTVAVPSGIAAR